MWLHFQEFVWFLQIGQVWIYHNGVTQYSAHSVAHSISLWKFYYIISNSLLMRTANFMSLGTECKCNNPCLNSGVCIDTGTHKFECKCPAGFTGATCGGQYSNRRQSKWLSVREVKGNTPRKSSFFFRSPGLSIYQLLFVPMSIINKYNFYQSRPRGVLSNPP